MSGHVAVVCLCVLFVWSVSSTVLREDGHHQTSAEIDGQALARIVEKRSQCKKDAKKVEEKLRLTSEQLTSCTSRLDEAQQKIIQNLNEKYDKILEEISSSKNNVEAGFVKMTTERESKFSNLQTKHGEMLKLIELTRHLAAVTVASLDLLFLDDHFYFFSKQIKMTWYEARDFCISKGLTLISIESAGEHQRVWEHKNKLSMTHTWLGASDEAQEGTWRWTGTGAALTYTNWWDGSPNQIPGQKCLYLYNGKWTNTYCASKIAFICEQQV